MESEHRFIHQRQWDNALIHLILGQSYRKWKQDRYIRASDPVKEAVWEQLALLPIGYTWAEDWSGNTDRLNIRVHALLEFQGYWPWKRQLWNEHHGIWNYTVLMSKECHRWRWVIQNYAQPTQTQECTKQRRLLDFDNDRRQEEPTCWQSHTKHQYLSW